MAILFPLRPPLGQGPGIGISPLTSHVFLDETQPPFNQLDWPNPPGRKSYILVSIATRPIQDGNIPFAKLDWPNPAPKLLKAYTWVNNNLNDVMTPVGPAPFYQSDWPNPIYKKGEAKTWIDNPVNPLSTPPAVLLPTGFDFPTPQRKPYLITHISSSIIIAPPTQPPFVNELFNNIPRKLRPVPRFEQSRPFYYSDIKPFKQDDWSIPIAKKSIPGFIFSRKPDEPSPQNPFITPPYPNPVGKARINPDWIFLAPFQQIFTHPVGSAAYDPPVLRVKPMPNTWIQQRPSFYVEPASIPVIAAIDFVPRQKSRMPETIVNRFQLTSVVGNPFAQLDWPNPLRKKVLNPAWEFYYQLDDNNPPIMQMTTLPPQQPRRVALTHIGRGQLTTQLVGTPIIQLDYPNPILPRRQTLTYIVNLLQTTLNPGVGPTPFNQNDWPNPLIGKKNFHAGWIQPRPFYFDEPIPQIRQNDWPVFRSIRRNDTGFISFRIQTSDPNIVIVDFVPQRKKQQTLSYAITSILNLTAISGAIPFNQTSWPVPRRVRVNRDILSILKQLDINLPLITGREVCLIAAEDEYYLLAEEFNYDLDATESEYYLDAGGNDCE